MRQSRNRFVTTAAAVAVLGLALAGGSPARAQDATPEAVFDPTARIPARIHAGTCDDLGEVAFPLNEAGYGLPVPVGPGATPATVTAAVVPAEGANPAAVSVTAVAATLDQLLGAPHAVTAERGGEEDEAEAETRIACGAIGGYRAGDDLAVGLGEQNGSDYAGTAWLHDNRDGTTTVVVFLASGLTNGGAVATQGVRPDAGASLAEVPAPVEVTGVVVADGAFALDELRLREGVPTILHVANADDRPYRLRIGDLVTTTPLPADAVTTIEFTTPTDAAYEGQLLAAEGDRALDAVRVVVAPPDEVVP